MRIQNTLLREISVLLALIAFSSCTEDLPQVPTNQNNWKVVVQTDSLKNINYNSATLVGTITEFNADKIVNRGFCWDSLPNPTIEKNKTELGTGSGQFICFIEDLLPRKEYFVRAFAETSYMIFYGNERSFTSLDGLPKIKTMALSNLSSISVQSGGEILDTGGSDIISRGVCWSKFENPTISDNVVTNDSVENVFACTLTELKYNSIFFVRAFATNLVGTAYGESISFLVGESLPYIKTIEISDSQTSTITVLAQIINDGGEKITQKGICSSKHPNPTIHDDVHLENFPNIDPMQYYGIARNLELQTQYYLRAFASNKNGIGYGEIKKASTADGLAIIDIRDVTNVNSNSAICEYGYYAYSEYPVTATGILLDTVPNTTLNDIYITVESVETEYSIKITDLKPNTLYYIQAYAKNSIGTKYSGEYTFQTAN